MKNAFDRQLKQKENDSKIFTQKIINDDVITIEELDRYKNVFEVTHWTGSTPLIEAVKHDKNEFVNLLLAMRANPNTQDEEGQTALSFAAINGNVEALKRLLDSRANPNISDHEGKTPVYWANEFKKSECQDLIKNHPQNEEFIENNFLNEFARWSS
jgi:ankyrin repeat protein